MIKNHTSFPDTYIGLSKEQLLKAYDAGPIRLTQVLAGLNETDLRAHLVAGKWCVREIVLHVADAEIMGAARIRQTFAQPGSAFAAYNQEVWRVFSITSTRTI